MYVTEDSPVSPQEYSDALQLLQPPRPELLESYTRDLYGNSVNMCTDIEDFHVKFGFMKHYNRGPHFLDPEMAAFRKGFQHEEICEYDEAIAEGDLNKACDALIDAIYVNLGTLYLHGIPAAEAWRRVQGKNMQKVRALREDDSERSTTFDVVKPEGWTPPDHSNLVVDKDHAFRRDSDGYWYIYLAGGTHIGPFDNMDNCVRNYAQLLKQPETLKQMREAREMISLVGTATTAGEEVSITLNSTDGIDV